MNRSEVLTLALSLHRPDEREKEGMVYQVWEDGEITLQKGGRLFGLRTVHCIKFGGDRQLNIADLPGQGYNHGYVFVDSHENAEKLSAAIINMEEEG